MNVKNSGSNPAQYHMVWTYTHIDLMVNTYRHSYCVTFRSMVENPSAIAKCILRICDFRNTTEWVSPAIQKTYLQMNVFLYDPNLFKVAHFKTIPSFSRLAKVS